MNPQPSPKHNSPFSRIKLPPAPAAVTFGDLATLYPATLQYYPHFYEECCPPIRAIEFIADIHKPIRADRFLQELDLLGQDSPENRKVNLIHELVGRSLSTSPRAPDLNRYLPEKIRIRMFDVKQVDAPWRRPDYGLCWDTLLGTSASCLADLDRSAVILALLYKKLLVAASELDTIDYQSFQEAITQFAGQLGTLEVEILSHNFFNSFYCSPTNFRPTTFSFFSGEPSSSTAEISNDSRLRGIILAQRLEDRSLRMPRGGMLSQLFGI